jgi:hypothetical protein
MVLGASSLRHIIELVPLRFLLVSSSSKFKRVQVHVLIQGYVLLQGYCHELSQLERRLVGARNCSYNW